MDHAFRWPFNPREFENTIRIDPRLKRGSVGFCAVENGKIVGFVGTLDIATRTLDEDIDYVGGIYGVATLPSHARKGISTALMMRAQEYFKEKGFPFVLLNTNRTLVAYSLYQKLGYTDLLEKPSTYKIFRTRVKKKPEKRKPVKLDPERILETYNKSVKEKTGFVLRDKAYLKMLLKNHELTPKQCIIKENGYVFFRKEKADFRILELIGSNKKQMERLVRDVENEAKDLIYDRAVIDDALLQVYEARGYYIQMKGYSVMMVKSLSNKASFRQVYGEKFYMTYLDSF